MSIEVNDITKLYGEQKALNQVSFKLNPGEIVGFLGPNGAGKSTMMKILSCYITPSSGSAKVCGLSVHEQSIEVRKKVGYLPEHNPLYTEMYIKEFLAFTAGLHQVKNIPERVEEMIEMVGLQAEQHKKIEALSKGYRQRVGLAQALIHNPEVLILDEPTSGLDPNQLVEIRSLIKNIGKEKTVLLSTHIMQEVEAICNRVIIINKGNIVKNAPIKELTQVQKQQVLTVEFDKKLSVSNFSTFKSEVKVNKLSDTSFSFTSLDGADIRREINTLASNNNAVILSMELSKNNLEDVFKQLTKA